MPHRTVAAANSGLDSIMVKMAVLRISSLETQVECQTGNSCRISESNGGIQKPTIKHMGIRIIVRSVGGHDRRQIGTNQCAPLQHPGRQFDVLPA